MLQVIDHSCNANVVEPRRVAAISMAQRVSNELNVEFGRQVGYQVSPILYKCLQIKR